MTKSTVERIDVDPRTLLVDLNIRHDTQLNKDFVASIKELGVLVAIGAVRTSTGDIRVRYGHRRTLAAVEAGQATVPVEILGDEGTDDAAEIERIVTQHAENAHRASLTVSEELGVVEQLSAFGMTPFQIQKRTRMKRPAIDQAIAVASSELAKEAAARYDFLSLEKASAVAEFEDDRDAVKALVVAAKEGRFEHTLQRLRDDREERASRQEAETALTELGITLVERPKWGDAIARLSRLTHDGESLDETTHKECPGHAAYLDEEWQTTDEEADDDDEDAWTLVWSPVYVCTDPVAYGHVDSTANGQTSTTKTEADGEEAKAERKRVLANNKAWRSAETVRREWLRSLLSRKSAPKGAMTFVLGELVRGSLELRQAMERGHAPAVETLGIEDSHGALNNAFDDASDNRAQVIAFGLVLCAHDAATGVHSWRSQSESTKRYLTALSSWGYDLSDVESLIVGDVNTE